LRIITAASTAGLCQQGIRRRVRHALLFWPDGDRVYPGAQFFQLETARSRDLSGVAPRASSILGDDSRDFRNCRSVASKIEFDVRKPPTAAAERFVASFDAGTLSLSA